MVRGKTFLKPQIMNIVDQGNRCNGGTCSHVGHVDLTTINLVCLSLLALFLIGISYMSAVLVYNCYLSLFISPCFISRVIDGFNYESLKDTLVREVPLITCV